MHAHTIHFIATGGTIDSVCLDRGLQATESALLQYIRDFIKPYFSLTEECLFMKDSRDITQEDRALILDRICHSVHNHIIVTHGTYTLAESARYLAERLPTPSDKRIILTGSTIPFGLPDSPALFNLGYACHAVQTCPPGVWVVFNGNLWSPKGLHKNLDNQRFESEA